ncbi:MAG: hypothetical protein WAP74_00150 [Patescibacteria group bacterium]
MEISSIEFLVGVIGLIITIVGVAMGIGKKLQVLADLKTDFKELRTDVRDLIGRMAKMEGKLEGVASSASPLQPTELGVKYIKDSGLEKILDDKKEHLFGQLENMLPPNYPEYDVQEAARRLMLSLKDELFIRPVKDYAFKEGKEIEVILGVGALWLRDDFLNRPRGIAKKEYKV